VRAIHADGYLGAAKLSQPAGARAGPRGGHQRTEQPPVNANDATLTEPRLRRAMYQLGRGDHFIYDGGGCRHRRLSR